MYSADAVERIATALERIATALEAPKPAEDWAAARAAEQAKSRQFLADARAVWTDPKLTPKQKREAVERHARERT